MQGGLVGFYIINKCDAQDGRVVMNNNRNPGATWFAFFEIDSIANIHVPSERR